MKLVMTEGKIKDEGVLNLIHKSDKLIELHDQIKDAGYIKQITMKAVRLWRRRCVF
jgi:hypothetical protein